MHATFRHLPKVSRWVKPSGRWLQAVAVMVIVTACQTSQVPPSAVSPSATHAQTARVSATAPATETTVPASETPTVTAFISQETQVHPTFTATPTLRPTVVPDPFQLVFPTPGPIIVTDWRPPLYPTPWAPTVYDHFYFASPIAANEINIPVQDYRYGGMFFEDIVHTGVDIPAPIGTPILSAGSGTVLWAGYGLFKGGYDPTDPYGLAVTIQHDFGYRNQSLYTVYGHMDEINVVEGQHVDTGDVLGLVGETGAVTGPHLHFEVRLGENSFFATRNPELWLVPPIGWGIIAGRLMDTVGIQIYDQQIVIRDEEKEQNWLAWSYGKTTVNNDAYYQENLVIGDIPAGVYTLRTSFAGVYFNTVIEVHPGMVNYFTFRGYNGFTIESPPLPGMDFTPAPAGVASP
jgi:murein DD-endopeptidase MepM/ murein hydrolase activator NlpD